MDTKYINVKGAKVPEDIHQMIKQFGQEPWDYVKRLFSKFAKTRKNPGFGCSLSMFFRVWASRDGTPCYECLRRPYYVDPSRKKNSSVPNFMCLDCHKSKTPPHLFRFLRPLFNLAKVELLEIATKDPKDIPDNHLCLLCFSEKRSIVLLPCKHLCLCSECYSTMEQKKDQPDYSSYNPYGSLHIYKECPVCRTPIEGTTSGDPGIAGDYFT